MARPLARGGATGAADVPRGLARRGAPVTAASVSLVLGFWVGAFGSFKPTIYFSLLTGLTMITGVVCDLLVLPASSIVTERWTKRQAG